MIQEQRRYTRLVIRSMDIKCKMSFDSRAELINIGLNGACISSQKQLKIGDDYELRFESSKDTITVKSIVVWEKMDNPQRDKRGRSEFPAYRIGLKFNDVLSEKGDNVLNFMEGHTNSFFKRLKLRLEGVRVSIFKPQLSTAVESYEKCSVIKLSLGGMLIETEQPREPESRVRMEITIPELKLPVKFLGRIASCIAVTDAVPGRYGIGVEFIEMSKGDRARLNKFINSLME